MKKHGFNKALLVALAILATETVYAQADWNLGGNSISSGNFLGTTNGFPIEFRTNNSPWLWLETSGGLAQYSGVGSLTPRPAISPGTNMGEIHGQGWGPPADEGFLRLSAGGGTNTINKVWMDFSGYSDLPDMDRNITFGTQGAERMRITNSGTVGIGTATPENSEGWNGVLDVHGTAHAKSIVTAAGIQSGIWSHSTGFYGAPAGGITGTWSNHPFSIMTNYTSRMTINTNGDVGIGTTTPGYKLTVDGQVAAIGMGGLLHITNPTANTQFFSSSISSDVVQLQAGKLGLATMPHLAFLTGGGIERMRITSGGNVGIGTTNPAYPLDVNGDVNIAPGAILRLSGIPVFNANNTNLMAGYNAGINTSSSGNVFTGPEAGYTNTTGAVNIFSGYRAGYSNNAGNENVYIGKMSGYSNEGYNNVYIGSEAGYAATAGSYNVFIGASSGYSNSTGYSNLFSGNEAGYYNSTGTNNTFLGDFAGFTNTTGNFNTFLGSGAINGNTNTNKSTAIGYQATVTTNNTMALGGATGSTNEVKVLIGYSAASTYTLDVNGNSRNTTGVWVTSDKRFKENVNELTNAMDKIRQLKPVSYDLIKDSYMEDANGDRIKLNFMEGKQIGFIAQELEEVIPELVSTDLKGYKAVNYAQMVSVLTQGMKEQDAEISSLHSTINELQTRLAALEQRVSGNRTTPATGEVTTQEARLEQNNPNPFSETTSIRYFIPQNAGKAKVVIRSITSAQEVMSFDIREKGSGTLIVSGGVLPAGSYSSELYVDGKLVDTKKMILVK